LLVLAAALLLFGSERLPGIARALGQTLNEMRRTAGEFSSAIMEDFFSSDQSSSEQRKQRLEEGKREG